MSARRTMSQIRGLLLQVKELLDLADDEVSIVDSRASCKQMARDVEEMIEETKLITLREI